MIDILDRLQNENSYVRLVLNNGGIVYCLPQCIVFEEDKEGWETIKHIMVEPCFGTRLLYYRADEIVSYERVEKKDIPQHT